MGRLAGFSYCEVARKPRTFGFAFDRPGRAATKSGEIPKQAVESPSPTIAATWRKERCAQFCARLGLMSIHS
jgi:hypothetical protein